MVYTCSKQILTYHPASKSYREQRISLQLNLSHNFSSKYILPLRRTRLLRCKLQKTLDREGSRRMDRRVGTFLHDVQLVRCLLEIEI